MSKTSTLRRLGGASAGLALALSGAALMPAGAADDNPVDLSTARAPERLTVSGTPIDGSNVNTPATMTPGDWTDTLPAGSETPRTYLITRNTADSTLRLSALAQAADSFDTMDITVYPNQSSEECDTASGSSDNNVDVYAAEIVLDGSSDCTGTGIFRVEVLPDPSDSDSALPFQVRFAEEPKITNIGGAGQLALSVSGPPLVSGEAVETEGTASFASAAPLKDGLYGTTVAPGETKLFRVPLEYNQALHVGATVPILSENTQQTFGSGPRITLKVLDPMHGVLEPPEGATVEGVPGEEKVEMFTATSTVTRGLSADSAGGNTQLAGDYYVAISVQPNESTLVLPVDVAVKIAGDPTEGPTYLNDEDWTLAGQLADSGTATDDDGTGNSSASKEKGGFGAASMASGGAGIVLILFGGYLLARNLRRARRA